MEVPKKVKRVDTGEAGSARLGSGRRRAWCFPGHRWGQGREERLGRAAAPPQAPTLGPGPPSPVDPNVSIA